MPKGTMQDENEYPLPEDTPFPARLDKVEERVTRWTYQSHHQSVIDGRNKVGEEGEIVRWSWTFRITDGDYAGVNAYGETEPKLTTHPDNLVRQWAEVLRGKTFELGESFDTDDLLGLTCIITVRHDPPREKRDGGKFYPCPVDSVFPADALGVSDPPF